MSAGYRNCPNCGRLITSDATVCRHCGANLGGNENSSRAEAREPQGDRANGRFNFPEVLTFMFQDRNIAQKLGALSLLGFLSLMLQYSALLGTNTNAVVEMGVNLPYYIASIIIWLIITGYNFSLIESISSQSGNYKIPAINFAGALGRGFTFLVAGIIFAVGMGVIVILSMIMSALVPPLAAIGMLFAIIIMLAFYVFIPAFMWIFANHRYFTIFFRFPLAIRCIAYDFVRYVIAIVAFLVYAVFCAIIYFVSIFSMKSMHFVLYSLIMSVLGSYSGMIIAYIIAKSLSSDCRQELY